MASVSNQIQDYERQIDNLARQQSLYQDRLTSSPTALGGTGQPTSSDVANQLQYERLQKEIQALQDQRLRTKWYPEEDRNKVAEEGSPGVIGSTLDFLARPLYGIVGATKHAIGQGSGSLYQDIADNAVRNRNTFSDVLRTAGVTGGVAAPLGFALDVALDPVNWLTAGTGALLPRLGVGAYKGLTEGKGLLKGLSVAAKSGTLQKATTVGRFTPFIGRTRMGAEALQNLGKRSLAAGAEWEALSGATAARIAAQKGIGIGSTRIGVGEGIKKLAEAIPGGTNVLDAFWYSPQDWIKRSHMKDVFQKHLGMGVNVEKAIEAWKKGPDSLSAFLREEVARTGEKIRTTIPYKSSDVFADTVTSTSKIVSPEETEKFISKISDPALAKKLEAESGKMVDMVDGAYMANEVAQEGDHVMRALHLTQEELNDVNIKLDDLENLFKSGAMDDTGVAWYDDMMKKIRSYEREVGSGAAKITVNMKKVLDRYEQAIAAFKVFKVGSSPAAFSYAIIGNAAMTHMGPGLSVAFIRNLFDTAAYFFNRPGAANKLQKIINQNPQIWPFLDEFPTAVRATFGSLNLRDINKAADNIFEAAVKEGKIPEGVTKDQVLGPIRDALEDLRASKISKEQMDDLLVLRKAMNKTDSGAGTSAVREVLTGGGADAVDKALAMEKGGFMGAELFGTRASTEMMQKIALNAKENPNHLGWKVLDGLMNVAPSHYDKIDQSFKLTNFLTATTHGYSIEEIRKIRNLVDITPEELANGAYQSVEEGRTLYKLSPKTALELSNVLYLNYNAMPAAVRVLRSMPLMGSPFIAFMYGLALRTGQTFAYNPAAFNKVTFAMNDFGGTKDPLEKKALESKYSSYLKQPGMYRLPKAATFFVDYPVYLNLANAIPYYSISMFGASQATYSGDSFRETVASAVQRSPILKDPIGSTIFDYIILPQILGESIRPQGMFGQPLYPLDATGTEKALYGARSLAEAFTPNIAAYAGLVTPEAAAPYLPLYRWRAITNAKYGKNQLGISSKEPPLNRTFRELLKATGVPMQAPVDTRFVKE